MIMFEDDPVWTPLNPKTGDAEWNVVSRGTLLDARIAAPAMPHARWDADAQAWITAPPAPVEVTGVPSRYVVIDRDDDECEGHATLDGALTCAATYDTQYPSDAPHRVEACIPVPRNEANDG